MPRRRRICTGEFVFHVVNRACRRDTLFFDSGDYRAFLVVLCEASARFGIRLMAYCVMPNHWHLVLRPANGEQLSDFMHWLTMTHTQRWHCWHHTTGTGPLYQGRFKATPVQCDDHLLRVIRYVERNPLKAGLVTTAETWKWSSLSQRLRGFQDPALADWPVAVPSDWVTIVNTPLKLAESQAIAKALRNGAPYGNEDWTVDTAEVLGLQSALRPRGRPRKKAPDPFLRYT